MKVKVKYELIKTVEVEIPDKFDELTHGYELPYTQEEQLEQEMFRYLYYKSGAIEPDGSAYITDVYKEEDKNQIYLYQA